jgi:hypothetical protein
VTGGLHETPARRVGQWVKDVVSVESPVHKEVVARRIVKAAGVSRLGNRIRQTIQAGIAFAQREGWVEAEGDVLFRPNQDAIPVRDRGNIDGVAYDIDRVPSQEIAAAAEHIVEVSYGINREDLVPEVGRALGFGRVGSNIQQRIGAVIEDMLRDGRLARSNGHLVVPS